MGWKTKTAVIVGFSLVGAGVFAAATGLINTSALGLAKGALTATLNDAVAAGTITAAQQTSIVSSAVTPMAQHYTFAAATETLSVWGQGATAALGYTGDALSWAGWEAHNLIAG